jgi:hypothetical protein
MPSTIWANKSRPPWLVPNQCVADGPVPILSGSIVVLSHCCRKTPAVENKHSSKKMTRPATAVLLRRNLRKMIWALPITCSSPDSRASSRCSSLGPGALLTTLMKPSLSGRRC